jgi:hypothetical protein
MYLKSRVQRLRAWWKALFYEPHELESYRERFRSLVTELESKLSEDVFLRMKEGTRLVELATEHDVIAKVTVFPKGIGFRRDTYVIVRMNPRYQAYAIWFGAAFVGFRQKYTELKPVLCFGTMKVARERLFRAVFYI